MKFKLYRENGALNSHPIFNAFSEGLKNLGHQEVNSNEDISVIWSVLWKGRMKNNRLVYEKSIKSKKPVIIIEVGNLRRNETWRISFNHINRMGIFGNLNNLDASRPRKLNVELFPEKKTRKSHILICTQLPESLQWQGLPAMNQWLDHTIKQIRKYSNRKIVIRSHPRSNLIFSHPDASVQKPKKLNNTYDDFDIDFDCHCLINHNSGPAIQAAIHGTPIICDSSSLAYPLSGKIEDIEKIILPDRDQWFLELCHTEWTVDEIKLGIPISRLLESI